MNTNIVIVGNGIAGDEAAFSSKKTNPRANVVLVTREPYPLYSACVLADYIAGTIPRNRVFLKKKEEYYDAGIKLLLSTEVSGWDTEKTFLQINNKKLFYDKLILATGSRTFIPQIHGADKKGVYSLKSLADADLIRNAGGNIAVVVGSGPVGIEVSVALQKRGYSVILIELLNHILPYLFDPSLSETIRMLLEKEKIEVRTGERVLEIMGNNHVKKIKTDKEIIQCDIIVLVAGMRSEVTLAKEEGIELGMTGCIKVNDAMQTSKDNVWACGDCIESSDRLTGQRGSFMLWNNARLQGRTAGINAAQGNVRYQGSINVTNVNIFNTAVAAIGSLSVNLHDDKVKVIHRKGHNGELMLVFKEENLIGAQAIGCINAIGGLLKILLRKDEIKNIIKGKQNQLIEYWGIRGFIREFLKGEFPIKRQE